MDDLKLQLLAAQAAGLEVRRGNGYHYQSDMLFRQVEDSRGIVTGVEWSPLKDDGDALRLAVKLAITDLALVVGRYVMEEKHREGDDIYAITRRAITRAAAAMANVAPGAGGGGNG